MSTLRQWGLFILSIFLMGIWFPLMRVHPTDRYLFRQNFGLNQRRFTRVADNGDSLEDAFRLNGHGSIFHKIKNISHEWAKDSPKRAVKFLSFIVVIQTIVIIVLWFNN
jgi:hypothetical protein